MLIKSRFKPVWWCRNRHLQTIIPSLFRKVKSPSLKRERLVTVDGDFLDLDFCGAGNQPLVILLHGLTGSSQSSYILGLQVSLLKQGLRSVALNFRGCSEEFNQTSRCYHSGETGDIDFLYRTLKTREPNTPLAAVGFSIGGNVLLKWLGEQGSSVDLFAATAVSVPFELGPCATQLDSGFSRIYRQRLIRELKEYITLKYQHLLAIGAEEAAEQVKQIGDLSQVRSFWQYDQRVIAQLYDFTSADDYYQRSSSKQFLQAIKVPTLLIQSLDDPFMSEDIIPSCHELSESVVLELTQAGGHVGFVEGRGMFKFSYWLDQRIPEFLNQKLTEKVSLV
ncbi:MAG: hydrolase [Methyloprofundus sp.]|nr:hydrolase [Methyloprofundus sp.]